MRNPDVRKNPTGKPASFIIIPAVAVIYGKPVTDCLSFSQRIGRVAADLVLVRILYARSIYFRDGERVRVARLAMKPPVSQEDLSGRLAPRGVQITQTGISKLENQQRYRDGL